MDTNALLRLVAHAWSTRHGLARLALENPDKVERDRKAVDLLGRDSEGQARLVLEHTLVESFPNQRAASIAAVRMFVPLERMLTGKLPTSDEFKLTVRPGSVRGLRRKATRIHSWVEDWVIRTAPTLVASYGGGTTRHVACATVPGTDIELALYRWPRLDGRFSLMFEAPSDPEQVLCLSVARAFAAKCPKLAEAKAAHTVAESLLLLEIHDIQLSNLVDLDNAVRGCLDCVTSAPDHVWLVDTTDAPPSTMISKELASLGDAIVERFTPFHLRPAGSD